MAPIGTAFPLVDAVPGASWIKLGTSGNKNYEDDGVVVTHSQTIEVFRGAGATGPRKAFRTEEDQTFGFTLVDLSPEQYAKAINDASVTTQAAGTGVPGSKRFSTLRGLNVAAFALLARGLSTVLDSLAAQYEVPIAYEAGSPAPAFSKGAPAGLELEFASIEDATTGFGVVRIQTAVAS